MCARGTTPSPPEPALVQELLGELRSLRVENARLKQEAAESVPEVRAAPALERELRRLRLELSALQTEREEWRDAVSALVARLRRALASSGPQATGGAGPGQA